MLATAEAGDPEGLALLSELSAVRCGQRWAGQVLADLPANCRPECVPPVLHALHGGGWITIARNIVIEAACQLSSFGVVVGEEISFSSDSAGVPTLHMAANLHAELKRTAPHSLQLVSAFLRVE